MDTTLNTIAGQWATFRRVINPDAPPDQVREMQLAFYAGAEAMMRIQFAIGGKGVTEAAGIAILEAARQEAQAFARSYGQRRGVPQAVMDAFAPAEPRKHNA